MQTCPLLLRVFCNTTGRHNNRTDYGRNVPGNELQIYTWLDATLKELTRLITEVYPNTKTKGTSFNFCTVYPDPYSAGFRMKDIGETVIGAKGPDDSATLLSKKFVIGDYLDVAVNIARSNAQPSASGRDRDRERDRERDRDRDGRDNRPSGRDAGADYRGSDNRRMRPYPDYR